MTEWPEDRRISWIRNEWVIPAHLDEFLAGPPDASQRVMSALLDMVKLDIAALRAAREP